MIGESTVSRYDEVVSNIKQFNKDLQDGSDLANQLSQFKHWYYVPDIDMFGPSKFIGYANMNANRYNRGHRLPNQKVEDAKPKDGRETVVTLKKWFRVVTDKELLTHLEGSLRFMLHGHGKKPNKKTRIHLPIGLDRQMVEVLRGRAKHQAEDTDNQSRYTDVHSDEKRIADNALCSYDETPGLPKDLVKAFTSYQDVYNEPLFEQVIRLYDTEPDVMLIKARLLLERLMRKKRLEVAGEGYSDRLDDLIRSLQSQASLPQRIVNHMHNIRTVGNVAVHEGITDEFTKAEALNVLQSLWIVADYLRK